MFTDVIAPQGSPRGRRWATRQGWLLACLAGCWHAAQAQSPVATACPRASEITQPQLLGAWQAEVDGSPPATLQLHRNAAHPASLSGSVQRGQGQTQVVGDIEDGEFTLEESRDGTRVSATWVGELVDSSCGREIRGTWQAGADTPELRFVLRKLGQP